MKPVKRSLDPVVKIGLTVLIGGFLLIGGGMFLSRPDRTIPPYSIGAQEETVVVIHVPTWTSDPEIDALIRRFREVGLANHDFRSMKVRPTTPENPKNLYNEVALYIFSDPSWADQDTLHRYLSTIRSKALDEFRIKFKKSVRGGFIYLHGKTKGWLGPLPDGKASKLKNNIQVLFDDVS